MVDQPIKKSNLLILHGVFLADFAEQAAVILPDPEPTINYSEIPKRFIDIDLWPRETNLLCWSCSLVPTGAPMFIPQNPEVDATGREPCDALGNFCDGMCAWRYAQEVLPSSQHWDIHELIARYESKFGKRKRDVIPKGPAKTEMKAYCGSGGITVKQWRDKMSAVAQDYSS